MTHARRAIVFQIDNLHHEAPAKLGLANVLALAAEGTSVAQARVPVPWHQTTGDYGKVHSTSLPNPVTFAGTMFLRPGQPMIQSSFDGVRAHLANSNAYGTLNPGFNLTFLDSRGSRKNLVETNEQVLEFLHALVRQETCT